MCKLFLPGEAVFSAKAPSFGEVTPASASAVNSTGFYMHLITKKWDVILMPSSCNGSGCGYVDTKKNPQC